MQQNQRAKKTPARAQQLRSQKTRAKLLNAATECLVKYNVAGLRFSQIAKMAKVPQPLMDYHFPSLDFLMNEMVLQQLEKFRAVMVGPMEKYANNPKKALAAYIASPYALIEKDAGFRAVWTLFYHLASNHRGFADLNREVRKLGRERIMALVTMTLATERKKRAVTTQELSDYALQIQGIVIGFGFLAAAESDIDFKKVADASVDAAFKVLGIER